jgi:hypothetical protein
MNLIQLRREIGDWAWHLACARGKRPDKDYPTLNVGGRVVNGRVTGGRNIEIRLVQIYRPAAGHGGFGLIADSFDMTAANLVDKDVLYTEPGEGIHALRVTAAEIRHEVANLSRVRLVCR